MRRYRRTLQRLTLFFTLALCALAAAAVVEYFRRGGNPAALADAIVQTAQGEGMPRPQNGEAWRNAWQAAPGAGQRVWDWTRGWMEPTSPEPWDLAPLEPGLGDRTDAAIQVYFGPVQPGAPDGLKRALLALIDGAREEVLVAAFQLNHDGIADALIARHAAGVRVQVVSDSDYADRAPMQRVKAAGIPVRLDERSAYMHNKFVVVDGEAVWTGSTNLTDNGFFRNANNAVLVIAPALAANFAVEFHEMHRDGLFGPRSPPGVPHPRVFLDADRKVRTYFAPEDNVMGVLVDEVRQAQTRIDFMAYAFSSEPLAEAMAARLRQGVRVRGLFERLHAGRDWSRDNFLAAHGAAIFVDETPGKMHHKVLVIDALRVATGSFNFSRNADESNDENLILIRCADTAARYLDEMDRLLLEAREGPI